MSYHFKWEIIFSILFLSIREKHCCAVFPPGHYDTFQTLIKSCLWIGWDWGCCHWYFTHHLRGCKQWRAEPRPAWTLQVARMQDAEAGQWHAATSQPAQRRPCQRHCVTSTWRASHHAGDAQGAVPMPLPKSRRQSICNILGSPHPRRGFLPEDQPLPSPCWALYSPGTAQGTVAGKAHGELVLLVDLYLKHLKRQCCNLHQAKESNPSTPPLQVRLFISLFLACKYVLQPFSYLWAYTVNWGYEGWMGHSEEVHFQAWDHTSRAPFRQSEPLYMVDTTCNLVLFPNLGICLWVFLSCPSTDLYNPTLT